MNSKKLLALAMVGFMAVGIFAAPVNAATGEANIILNPNASGPGPIDPSDPDNDKNNWMVYYPSKIILGSGNVNTDKTDFDKTGRNGVKMRFKATRQIAGANGSTDLGHGNIMGHLGIRVSVLDSTSKTINGELIEWKPRPSTDIPLFTVTGDNYHGVKMSIRKSATSATGKGLATKQNAIAGLAKKEGSGPLTSSEVEDVYVAITDKGNAIDGAPYTTTITYLFHNENP